MEKTVESLSLDVIHRAQQGDPDSQGIVAELMRPKVYAYIYRMTLDAHVAEDLCQETMVKLVEHLPQLTVKAPSFLWAWVYRAALNQIRDNYRQQRAAQDGMTHVKQTSSGAVRREQAEPTGSEHAIRQELLAAVSKAIRGLKLQYRNVLTLRCFQQLSYAQIAQATGNTELGVRLLFFRAKQSLARQLARDGFDKSQLLPALTLFAAVTLAPAEKAAAATVTATAIHTGVGVKLLATLGTAKVGIGIAVVLAAPLIPLAMSRLARNDPRGRFHLVSDAEVAGASLAYPVVIRASYDPGRNGWRGGWGREQHTSRAHDPGPIQRDQWLLSPADPDKGWLLMPKGYWIEITFGGAIVDGAGDDIFITERCRHGEQADVSLVDEGGRTFPLAPLQIPSMAEHGTFTYGIDLSGMSLPFVPTAIRIQTTDEGALEYIGATRGLELLQVRARIRDLGLTDPAADP